MSRPWTVPSSPSKGLLETLREIRSARRTSDALEALRRFELTIRREAKSPAPSAARVLRAELGPGWLREDLKLREIGEAERELLEVSLELDALAVSGLPADAKSAVYDRHTLLCSTVRRLRREFEHLRGER